MTSDRSCPFVVSILPAAAHIDLTTLSSRRSTTTYVKSCGMARVVVSRSDMGWNDLLKHLRHIKTTNPRRVVRRLTFNRGQKLGSMSNLSSATAGLLTHIDFSRSHRDVDLEQLGINIPGLRGLGVSEDDMTHRIIQIQSATLIIEVGPFLKATHCGFHIKRDTGRLSNPRTNLLYTPKDICRTKPPACVFTVFNTSDASRKTVLAHPSDCPPARV